MSITRRSVLCGLAGALAAALLPLGAAAAQSTATAPSTVLQTGRFIGNVVAQWGENGRDMILTQPFEFIDPDGSRWPVPAGAQVNGASIPKIFWSVIGGPFEGLYRNASVVHDYYCGTQNRSYKEVHKVFYDAMIASGVDHATAWLMFQAVNRFGPRWSDAPPSVGSCPAEANGGPASGCTRGFAARSLKAAKPAKVDKDALESFLTDVQGKANADDIAKLRNEISKLD
jgi:Protein of unknown function (DUF1353)